MTQQTLTAAQKRSIKEALAAYDLTFHGDGTVTLKKGYFYHMGNTVGTLKEAILAAYPNAEVVDSGDRFAPWPKDSYLWVRFRPHL